MGKRAMVWGAGGGIGRALVERLVADGWSVAAVSRHPEGLETLTDCVIAADPAEPFQVEQAVLRCAQELGEADLWVYTAGDILSEPVGSLAVDDWQRIVNANLTGAFITTRYSLPLLAEDAHLLYVGAYHERLQLPGLTAYAAAKAGLQAFTTALAKEERKRRITLLRPGAVDTPLWEKVPMRLPKDALTPEAVADTIVTCHAEGQKGVLDI